MINSLGFKWKAINLNITSPGINWELNDKIFSQLVINCRIFVFKKRHYLNLTQSKKFLGKLCLQVICLKHFTTLPTSLLGSEISSQPKLIERSFCFALISSANTSSRSWLGSASCGKLSARRRRWTRGEHGSDTLCCLPEISRGLKNWEECCCCLWQRGEWGNWVPKQKDVKELGCTRKRVLNRPITSVWSPVWSSFQAGISAVLFSPSCCFSTVFVSLWRLSLCVLLVSRGERDKAMPISVDMPGCDDGVIFSAPGFVSRTFCVSRYVMAFGMDNLFFVGRLLSQSLLKSALSRERCFDKRIFGSVDFLSMKFNFFSFSDRIIRFLWPSIFSKSFCRFPSNALFRLTAFLHSLP